MARPQPLSCQGRINKRPDVKHAGQWNLTQLRRKNNGLQARAIAAEMFNLLPHMQTGIGKFPHVGFITTENYLFTWSLNCQVFRHIFRAVHIPKEPDPGPPIMPIGNRYFDSIFPARELAFRGRIINMTAEPNYPSGQGFGQNGRILKDIYTRDVTHVDRTGYCRSADY